MIELTALSGKKFWLNPDHFEKIEKTPDTVLFLTNGHSFRVLENPEKIIEKIIDFRGMIQRRGRLLAEGDN